MAEPPTVLGDAAEAAAAAGAAGAAAESSQPASSGNSKKNKKKKGKKKKAAAAAVGSGEGGAAGGAAAGRDEAGDQKEQEDIIKALGMGSLSLGEGQDEDVAQAPHKFWDTQPVPKLCESLPLFCGISLRESPKHAGCSFFVHGFPGPSLLFLACV